MAMAERAGTVAENVPELETANLGRKVRKCSTLLMTR
jgi:hypothetical protein